MPAADGSPSEQAWQALRTRLARSAFRSRFRLGQKEKDYLAQKGADTIRRHVRDFVTLRLAPAEPANDGRQTPMRGHPAFIAQHATATCCRGCLLKWHGIDKGRKMTPAEVNYTVEVILRWIGEQADVPGEFS